MVAALLHGARSWTGAKAIALLATIAFAVGIGATTAIYTVVNAVMLTPLPYEHGDRFVALYGARFSEPKQFSSNTLSDLQEYQQRTTSFDVFGGFSLGESNLSAPGEPRHVNVVSVTPALAHNLGVAPVIGRWFTDENGAVISYRLWRRLNADPTIVGRSMTLDGRALTLTGVFGAAGLLLVIACANVAGLLLARSVARARETATRVALGIHSVSSPCSLSPRGCSSRWPVWWRALPQAPGWCDW